MKEYIITVANPAVWDTLWDELTKDGLGDNFVPKRPVEVLNERPFNDRCAHFNLTDEEAIELRKDPRIQFIELQADLQEDVKKELIGHVPPTPDPGTGPNPDPDPDHDHLPRPKIGIRRGLYDKSNSISPQMKNWGLLRCINESNPFAGVDSVNGDYTYNLDGTGVDLIVMDSGVEPDHPEFAVNADGTGGSRVVDFDWSSLGVPGCPSAEQINGYLGDSDGHGSNCASIAAGNTCGWASGAAIYSLRIFDGFNIKTGEYLGAISSDIGFDLVRAFHLAKRIAGNMRPTICTNSWGYLSGYSGMQYTVWRGTQYNMPYPNPSFGQVYFYHPYTVEYLNIAVENCAEAGVILVGAAGNYRHKIDVPGGVDYDNYYRYYSPFYGTEDVFYHRGSSPCNSPSMVTVGAVDNTPVEQKAYFSESGPRVDVYAPGVMIMGAYSDNSYQTPAVEDPRSPGYYLNKISGTSQATPQVTGVLACLLQARPDMTTAEAKRWLALSSTKNVLVEGADPSYTNTHGLQGGANRVLHMPFTNVFRGHVSPDRRD